MKVRQISVFLENKSGRLAEVTQVLGENRVNIRALSIADTSDFGILRLIVNDPTLAYRVLKDAGYTVSENAVLAVEICDSPGGLAASLRVFQDCDVNIEYMYAFVGQCSENAVVVFKVADIDWAIDTLNAHGVKLLSDKEVYAL